MDIDLGSDAETWSVLLRTWYEGTFYDRHTWVLYTPRNSESSRFAARYLSHTPVDRDDSRLESPTRSVKSRDGRHGRTIELDPEPIRRLLQEGEAPISLVGFRSPMGLDGNRRGFASIDGPSKTQLVWWCDGPEEWRPFIAWVERLQRHLHGELFPGEPDVPRVSTA